MSHEICYQVIRYRVPQGHRTETVKGQDDKGRDIVLRGSVHHAETDEFTGLITRSHGDGTFDIVIFPPDKPPVHVHGVKQGTAPGTLTILAVKPPSGPTEH